MRRNNKNIERNKEHINEWGYPIHYGPAQKQRVRNFLQLEDMSSDEYHLILNMARIEPIRYENGYALYDRTSFEYLFNTYLPRYAHEIREKILQYRADEEQEEIRADVEKSLKREERKRYRREQQQQPKPKWDEDMPEASMEYMRTVLDDKAMYESIADKLVNNILNKKAGK